MNEEVLALKIGLRRGFFVCVLSFLFSTNVSAAEKEPTREANFGNAHGLLYKVFK